MVKDAQMRDVVGVPICSTLHTQILSSANCRPTLHAGNENIFNKQCSDGTSCPGGWTILGEKEGVLAVSEKWTSIYEQQPMPLVLIKAINIFKKLFFNKYKADVAMWGKRSARRDVILELRPAEPHNCQRMLKLLKKRLTRLWQLNILSLG